MNQQDEKRKKKMMERMSQGKLYRCVEWDPEGKYRRLVDRFNAAGFDERKTRTEKYLKPVFGSMGKNCYIEPPFFCDYGFNIHVGDDFYANTGFVVLDQCPVNIGHHVYIAPRTSIFCAGHPIDAMVRNTNLEYGKPVTIGDDVWIGGHVVINPGVTIGSNVVIGSGSVVTKDIPDNVVAVGNPCKVIREITEEDKAYWMALVREYEADMEEMVFEN